MKIGVIKDEAGYEAATRRIYELMHENPQAIEPGSEAGEELELLMVLVEKYERDHYPIEAPDPIEAIKFRMEQMGLKQKDIAALFGGKTRISEVLNRKRPLSMKMIVLLNRYLGIPLESLISGNESIRLSPPDRNEIMQIPAVREYLRNGGVNAEPGWVSN